MSEQDSKLAALLEALQHKVFELLCSKQLSFEEADAVMEMLFDSWKNHQKKRNDFGESLR